jgi:phage terminase large subunit-like protein
MMPPCGFVFDGRTCRKRGPHRCQQRVAHAVAFFAECVVHTKGEYSGRPFILAKWQLREIVAPLFGEVVWSDLRRRYVRRYRILYLFIARKNGKTELIAAITLYLLVADNEAGAEIYGLALDKDQAGMVYRVASRVCQLSPVLRKRLTVLAASRRITDELTGSVYVVVAGDAPGNLGTTPSAAYIDELLTQPDRELYDAVRTGMGTRAQPLLMLATTAENDPTGFAAQEREWSAKVLENPELEPERLVVMHTSDPDADWTDPETWKGPNPALGDFLDPEILASECRHAMSNPAAERAFRQYRLNQPVGQIGRAINLGVWDGAGPTVAQEELRGQACFGGLDLATTSDLAAYALDFPRDDGSHVVIWRHFAPESALQDLDRRTGGMASVWADDGLIHITPGDITDYEAIKAALEADAELFDIKEVAFDRWGAAHLSTQLVDAGWPLVAMGQGFAAMSPPTVELLRLIGGRLYRHGGNPLMRWQASNLITQVDPAGNLKPDKRRSVDKIDGIVAGIMALDRALRHSTVPTPDYIAAGF